MIINYKLKQTSKIGYKYKIYLVMNDTIALCNIICFIFFLVVEDLLKLRESIVQLEAIYLITPIKESIDMLIKDFSDKVKPMYKAAYVYFTQSKIYIIVINYIFLV